MRLEPCKSILHSVGGGGDDHFFHRRYNMNLYRGCSHGCVYCDARSACYRLEAPGEVRAKANALSILRDELRRKRAPGLVGMGGMSDGYNPQEETALLTRGALALLARYGFGVGITTKSPLVARDIDLLLAIRERAPVQVTFSITTADDSLSRKIEPGVAPGGGRFAAMAALAKAGILTGIWINPMLPFLTDTKDNLSALLAMTREHGGRYAHTYFGMTLWEGNREHYYAALDRHFPGLKQRYAETYGLSYILECPDSKALAPLFTDTCERLGLSHTFRDTNAQLLRSGGFRQERMLFS